MDSMVDDEMPPLGHFIISIRRGSMIRTFHLLGACHRTPGADYREWVTCGDTRPAPSEYTQACRQCWPRGFQATDEDGSSESSSDDRT